ncbi:hypothetical protein F5146DRAFT_1000177 [Armillaria mellea]|nr:hypothetical protein F5146DRAFT_1000177 [Armillaria mellea]
MAETEADENGHDVKAITQGKLPSGHDEEVAPPAPELDSPAKEVSLAALTEPVPEKKVKEAAAVKHKVVILTALVLATVSIRLLELGISHEVIEGESWFRVKTPGGKGDGDPSKIMGIEGRMSGLSPVDVQLYGRRALMCSVTASGEQD